MLTSRNLIVAAAAALLPVTGAQAVNVYNYWDAGTDGNWNVPTNWSEDRVPAFVVGDDSDYAVVNSGHTVTIDSDVGTARGLYVSASIGGVPVTGDSTVIVADNGKLVANNVIRISNGGSISVEGGDVSVIGSSFSFAVGDSGTGNSTLDVSAGSVTANNFRVGHGNSGTNAVNLSGTGQITGVMYLGGNSEGEVNQTGGVWTGGSHYIGTGSTGVYYLGGGELRSTGRFRIGHTNAGTLNMTGGELNATNYPVLLGSDGGSGDGLLAISSGDVAMNSGMYVGNSGGTGSGTLRITGNAATFNISNTGNEAAGLDVYANGTLNFQIGSAGVSTIMIESPSSSSARASLLAGTLDIDLLGGFIPTVGQTFDLISNANNYTGTTGGNFTNGFDITNLSLAVEDQPYWSFGVVNENDRNILRLTNTGAIPEPAGLALLGLAVPALLRRRVRRG